jgi:hypothetical protein
MVEIIRDANGKLRVEQIPGVTEREPGEWVVDVAGSRAEAQRKMAESIDRSRADSL